MSPSPKQIEADLYEAVKEHAVELVRLFGFSTDQPAGDDAGQVNELRIAAIKQKVFKLAQKLGLDHEIADQALRETRKMLERVVGKLPHTPEAPEEVTKPGSSSGPG